MRNVGFILWAVGVLVLVSPAVSSSQIAYVIDPSAPYAYVSGTTPIADWVCDIPPCTATDDGYFDLPLGDFVFQFYGLPVTTLRISTNGYMTFGTQGQEFLNRPIPSSVEPNALIAPFWSDLTLIDPVSRTATGHVRWGFSGTSPSRQLVIEWSEVWPYNSTFGGPFSFEAVLYESSNEIIFQYLNVESGTPLTIGVENFDGTKGSQFIYGTLSPSNGSAIQFIPKITTAFFDDFSTEKGWTGYETGGWERGPATPGGGENGNPDPSADYSATDDDYILGFAIGGDYQTNLVEKSIISPPINCTELNQVFLKFRRYLNVESNYYDHAKIYVSNDGANWTQFWENPVFNITDNQWIQAVFDISSVAANQATVWVKFAMGPTNASGGFSGWNIDDLELTSDYGGPMALYVASGGMPNLNIDEIMVENGLAVKHFNSIPSDLSDYDLLVVSDDAACNTTTADYIRSFVQNGGGAVIMSSTPNPLAGNTFDLSLIRDWFGAGSYGKDGGDATVAFSNPFGSDLLVDEKVDYSTPNSGAAIYNLEFSATPVSKWSSGGIHAFFNRFGQGRVFYYAGNPGYSEDQNAIVIENGLILFEAGLVWAVGCSPIIANQPQGQAIQSGQMVSMLVSAWGATPFDYQWFQGSSGDISNPISGAVADIYTTPALTQTTNYWVRVSNVCGSADSDTATITVTPSTCTAPTIAVQPQSQTIQSGQTASISVSASGTTPFSYQWYQGSSGETSNPISGGTSSSLTTPALTQTTSYWVNVTNSCGNINSNTAVITVVPAGPPSSPTNLSASDGTYTDKVEVTWTASLGATSYTVYRATALTRWAAKTSLGSTSETFFNDTTAIPKTTYYYFVKASNAYGTSNFSSYDAGYRSDGTPPIPTNVSASDGTYLDRVEVTWTASSGATSYTIYRTTSLGRRARKISLGTTSETTFNDTTATPKTTYYYCVKASNTYGTSNFSSYDSGYRSDGSPPIPTNVSASDGTYSDRVEVTWAASSGATSYTVYRATALTRWAAKTSLGTVSETSFNDTTATPGRTYYYWVKASNTYGTSDFSSYDAGYR